MLLTALILGLAVSQSGVPAPLGEAPFTATKSQIHIDATVNGHEGIYIFDTGFAGDLVFDASIDMGKSSGTISLQDFVGSFQAKTYKVKSLKLGGFPIKSTDLQAVAQPDVGNMGEGGHVDGLMGFSLIKNYVTTISFEKHKFIFYPSSLDISHWVPDNKSTFLLHMLPIGTRAIVLPVKTADGKLLVMALDTGNAFYATTHKDVLERVGLWPTGQEAKYMQQSFVASGAVNSWQKDMKNMNIFGVPVPDSTWDIIDLPASDAVNDGTIGYQFLKNFNITFDFQRRLVWLQNFTGKVENKPVGGVGMYAAYSAQAGALVVAYVSDDSPAAKAGIKTGDKVFSIDGVSTSGLTNKEISDRMKGEAGTKVTLGVSHDGFTKQITLTRAALVN